MRNFKQKAHQDTKIHLCQPQYEVIFNHSCTGLANFCLKWIYLSFRLTTIIKLFPIGVSLVPSVRTRDLPHCETPFQVTLRVIYFSNLRIIPCPGTCFSVILEHLWTSIGLDRNMFHEHPFRIEVATTVAKYNVPDHLIKQLGRCLSGCCQVYIRTVYYIMRDTHLLIARSCAE